MLKILAVAISAVCLLGCNGVQTVFKKEVPPYEAYIESLEKAALLKTPMSQAWIKAGKDVFADSVYISLPFTESGYFAPGQPEARSYRFTMREGQVLTVEGLVKSDAPSRLFLDLFVWRDNRWLWVNHADSLLNLAHEFDNNDTCLVRLQPELMIQAYYTISISATPVLINPVSGANNRSIRSFYGDGRDGGTRSHEGVDIFAKRGTPVVAPTGGTVSKVGTNRLGGKVIWMRDHQRGHAYYFAHLDSQLVHPGKKVMKGDTLGLVGNTGNARTTPPHLHFGIYQRGSKDPLHYLQQMEEVVDRAPLDTTFQSQVFSVTASQLNLRTGPGQKHEVRRVLKKHDYLKVVGQSGSWYRVVLPDKMQGFLSRSMVKPAEDGADYQLVSSGTLLSDVFAGAVPVRYLPDTTAVKILARYEQFAFVKTEEGEVGWLIL